MRAFGQIGAVTRMNLGTIRYRLGTSSVIVIGIAGVVAVLVSVLAMATGVLQTVADTGRGDRVLVLRGGSQSELASSIARDAALTIADAPGVRHDARGKPIASAESVSLVDLQIPKAPGVWASLVLRGVSSQLLELRPEIHLVEGRMFHPAVRELIAGRAAQAQFPQLAVGRSIELGGAEWRVVGAFESGRNGRESELLADSETALSSTHRNAFQAITVMLESAGSFERFKTALTTDPTLTVDVKRESEYFAEQSKPFSRLLFVIAYVVGGIMAIGAVFGALNTMYTAVSTRSVEIATLRAIGFGAAAVVVSVFAEALLLAIVGGVIGATIAYLVFNGHLVSSSAGNGIVQTVFALTVTPTLIAVGVVWAGLIGLIGGLFPALRAARLPVATALRAN